MAGKAIRSDFVEIGFNIDDSPLKKLNKQVDELQGKYKGISGDDSFKKLKDNISKCKNPLSTLSNSFEKGKNNAKKFFESFKKIDTESLNKLDKKLTDITKKLGGGVVTAAKKATRALVTIGTAAGTALGTIVYKSVSSFADYEQLIGGVETLFKDSAGTIQKYANDAYKTAGLSANQYMETVTSFSASLLQSLGGDTQKAAKYADLAVTDMSDNANKMGTDMSLIQNAYQGFAKQNYTMLDNLKLGYGGTKEEMQRLLSDAEKLAGKKFDLSSYADVIEAVHVIQESMDITGTTAKEAEKTISGSLASVKSAWSNLLPAFVQGGDSLNQCIDNLVSSTKIFLGNVAPVVDSALGNILGRLGVVGQSIQKVIDKIKGVASNSEKVNKLKSVFNSIKSVVETVSVSIANLVGKVIDFCTQESTLNVIKGVFDGINDVIQFCKDHFDGLSTAALAVGAAFLSVVGSVKLLNTIMAIQKGIQIASTVAQYAWAAATGATVAPTTAATAAQLGLNTALLANPITWIVIGVIAAIAALVAIIVVVIKYWDEIKAAALACWEKIKSVWGIVSEWFSTNIIQPIKNFFTNLWYFIVGVAVSIWNGLVSVFSPIATWVNSNVIQPVVNFFTNLWHSIVNIVAQVWSTICSIWGQIASWVSSNIIEPIKSFFSGLWTSVSGTVSSVKEAITSAFSSAYEKVVGIWEGITGFFKGIWDGIKGTVNKLINKGKEALGVESDVKNKGKKHAWGGLMTTPHWGLVAEDGAEMIIPLSRDKRSRGLSLWEQAGRMLGVTESQNSLSTYSPETSSTSGSSETYNGGDTYSPVFNLTVNNTEGDRQMEYKVKRWLKEGMDDLARGIARRNPKLREV